MGLKGSCILIRRKVIKFSYLLTSDQESLYIMLRKLRHQLCRDFHPKIKEAAGVSEDQQVGQRDLKLCLSPTSAF